MADQSSPSIEIVARLRDEVSAGLEKLRQNIQAFAQAATPAAGNLADGASEIARAAEAAAKRIEASTKAVQNAVRSAGSGAPGVALGANLPGSAASTDAAQTREAKAAIDEYLESLKLQSAARTLSNQEHSEALALYAAEANALRNGATLTEEQRQEIVSEVRAREQLLAFRAQEAAENARSVALNVQAGERARSQREQELRELRDSILARDAERRSQETARKALGTYLDQVREEAQLVRLTTQEREIAIARRKADELAVAAGISDRRAYVDQIEREVRALQREREATANSGRARLGLGNISGLTSLIPGGGGALGQITSEAQAGAAALEGLAASAGLSAGALGVMAAAGAGVAIGLAGLVSGVKNAIAVSDALKPVALASAESAEGIGRLKREIVDLSIATGRSQEEIAGAARVIRDLDPSRQAEFLRVSTQLAVSGLTTVGNAAESLDRVLDSFGESADRARLRSAQLFVAARAGESDVATFANALKELGPISNQLGIRFEDVAAVLGTISKRTDGAAQGARALGAVLGDLADPTSGLSRRLRDAGIDASALAIQTKDLGTVLAEIGTLIEARPDLATQIFGNPRTAKAVFAALQENGAETLRILDDATRAIGEQESAIARAKTATESWGKVWATLREASGIDAIGEGLAKLITQIEAASGSTAARFGAFLSVPGTIGQVLREIEKQSEAAAKQVRANLEGAFEVAPRLGVEQGPTPSGAPLAPSGAVQGPQLEIPKPAPIVLPFDQQASDEALKRTVESAISNLQRAGIGEQALPRLVSNALRELGKTGVASPSEAERTAAAKVVNDYATALQAAGALAARLRREQLTGTQREAADRAAARVEVLKTIQSLEDQGVQVDALRKAYLDLAQVQERNANDANQRELAGLRLKENEAITAQLKNTQALAIARGDVAQADRIGLELFRRENAEAARRIVLERDASIAAAGGDRERVSIALAIARSKLEALRLERETTAEVRRREALERAADSRRAIQGVRASLGTGLSGEIAKIRQGVEEEVARIDKALKDETAEILSSSRSTAAQEIADAQRVAAARKESVKFLGGRDEELAARRAAIANAEQLLRLESEFGATSEAQIVAKQGLIKLDQQRIRDAAVLNGATEDQLKLLDALFAKQLARPKQEIDLQNTFGSTNLPEIILRGRIEFDQAQLDADLAKKARELADELDKATEGLPRNSPEFNAAAEAMAERLRRLKFEADRANQSLSKGFRDEIEKLSLELGNDTRIGARLAEDAFRGLSSAIGDTLTQLENGKGKFRDVLASFARDLQSSINRAIGDKIAASFFSSFFLAKGGVAMNGSIIPFASGEVFDSPTLFPLRSGKLGMLGEAGPEAIMPLTRGRDGKLGVRAQAQQASAGPIITNHITISVSPTLNAIDARSGAEFLHSHAKDLANITAEQLNEQLSARVVEAVRRAAR